MTVSHGAQLLEFVYALILGLALGAAYVGTGAVHKRRAVLDLVFALTALVSCTAFFLTVCGGLVRGYQLAGIFLGMAGTVCLSRTAGNRMKRRSGSYKEKKWTEAKREKKNAGLLFF